MKKGEKEAHLPMFDQESPICQVEGCNGDAFREGRLCRHHFRIEMEKRQEQRELANERAIEKMLSKDYTKVEARGRFQSANRVCSRCGTFGLHHVVEKPKSERPKRPKNYFEILKVLCQDCFGGR
jgi:hypothetical protein